MFFILSVSVLYVSVLLLCLIGYKKNFFFITAVLLQLILFRSVPNFNYGYDHFITMSFFYCLIFPVSKELSIDFKKLKKKQHRFLKENKYNLLLFLKTHLSIVYFTSGIAKSIDINWWNGNAIWRSIANLDDFLYVSPLVLTFFSCSTVILEVSYPFLVFSKLRKLRKFLAIHIILMHIGIAVFLKLNSFAAVMILWNIIIFYLYIRKHS